VKYIPINFQKKYSKINEQWSPKVIAKMNDYQFKIAKIEGEFIWHKHDETDEVFIIVEGSMKIEFRDGSVNLKQGEMFVVPKGIEHKPIASKECKIINIEPSGTSNTGDTKSNRTVNGNDWI